MRLLKYIFRHLKENIQQFYLQEIAFQVIEIILRNTYRAKKHTILIQLHILYKTNY
jgi:hypothetical protein